MDASIIVIGDEILLGRVTDTNSGFIARRINTMGWRVDRVQVIGDDAGQIEQAVRASVERYPLTFITGGLGPTKDDITKASLCRVFGGEMEFSEAVYENVCRIFRAKHLQLNELTRLQAMVPTSCRVIQNVLGTAPIMWFESGGHVAVSMPGVPFETEGMLDRAVLAEVSRFFNPSATYTHRSLLCWRVSESALAERLAQWEDALPANFHLAYLPDSPVIRLRLDGSGEDADALNAEADSLFGELCALVGDNLVSIGADDLPAVLIGRLKQLNLTAGTAESCTGGNIAHAITAIAGASDVFAGSVVSYSNDVKHCVLGVESETLERHGAVSCETVEQMLAGACRVLGTDCAMATSGIAGPGGGTPEKPVGTVWIGVKSPAGTRVELYHMPGNRQRVIERSTKTAMLMLLDSLSNLQSEK